MLGMSTNLQVIILLEKKSIPLLTVHIMFLNDGLGALPVPSGPTKTTRQLIPESIWGDRLFGPTTHFNSGVTPNRYLPSSNRLMSLVNNL
jgi:hypothetical protein